MYVFIHGVRVCVCVRGCVCLCVCVAYSTRAQPVEYIFHIAQGAVGLSMSVARATCSYVCEPWSGLLAAETGDRKRSVCSLCSAGASVCRGEKGEGKYHGVRHLQRGQDLG